MAVLRIDDLPSYFTSAVVYGGDMGNEIMLIACRLGLSTGRVLVDNGSGFRKTRWRTCDLQGDIDLAELGWMLAAQWMECKVEDFDCTVTHLSGTWFNADGDALCRATAVECFRAMSDEVRSDGRYVEFDVVVEFP